MAVSPSVVYSGDSEMKLMEDICKIMDELPYEYLDYMDEITRMDVEGPSTCPNVSAKTAVVIFIAP